MSESMSKMGPDPDGVALNARWQLDWMSWDSSGILKLDCDLGLTIFHMNPRCLVKE